MSINAAIVAKECDSMHFIYYKQYVTDNSGIQSTFWEVFFFSVFDQVYSPQQRQCKYNTKKYNMYVYILENKKIPEIK